MHRNRDSSATIWRTVVFAGAMLGVPACGHDAKPAPTTPQNVQPAATPTSTTQTDPAKPDPTPATPTADPCGGGAMPEAAPTQAAAPATPDPATDPAPATPPKKRPRGGGDRPTGRGFVLA